MPPPEKPTVKIKIKTRFVDEQGGQLFGPGIWDVPPAVSMRLVAQGKATVVGAPAIKAPAPAKTTTGKPPATNPRIPPVTETEGVVTETPLPEGFPCQATLAVAGLDTVEKLKAPDIKERLAEVEGLTPADITKIGLAISKV